MNISENGLSFIKSFEGCRLTSYLDVGGIATIGWGMTYYPATGIRVKLTDPDLTQEQADDMFVLMVKPYAEGVTEALGGFTVNQNQFDSLVDFTYNLGVGAFKQSTLCQNVIDKCVVEDDFTLYDHAAGEVNAGLLKRRQAEYNVFMTPEVDVQVKVPISPIIDQSNNMNTTIKWVKFFNSEAKTYTTFFTESMTYATTVETFTQPDLAAVLAESTVETYVFWDLIPGGVGTQTA